MASKIQIWNLALNHIGQKAVQSDTEASVQANALNRVWTYALQEAIRGFNWGFAKVLGAGALVANYTPLTYVYAYAYPSKALVIWRITFDGAGEDADSELYKIRYDPDNNQKVIETNIEDAYIEYGYDVTDTTKFDASFVKALSHRLSAELAVPLNGDKTMAEAQIIIFNGLTSEAKRISANEKKKNHPANEKSEFVDARG